ncbi:hypothetical protein [Burkholderia cenocepacia]|uniref:hypothetical protein n=1 Tax=Burkholderia cenocepacia TaxID=95486 RepID=UPI0013DEB4E3|nr:hypothetical protein [Burkholderia cenocepacia]MCW3587387.1 hypothetical protein [Burkholderia cenocepacia]MCW3632591.1 hypothetical protein [Burkholderia cenocepacia]MCW5181822.1 hypothetical protein [Burkholderia cenocepacia]
MKAKTISRGLPALLLVAAANTLSNSAIAAQGSILQAYSPAQYLAIPIEQRQAYVAGVIDAARVVSSIPRVNELYGTCLAGMTIGQATAIVDARAKQPEPVDHDFMPVIVHNALMTDCNRRGFKELP